MVAVEQRTDPSTDAQTKDIKYVKIAGERSEQGILVQYLRKQRTLKVSG
jgi:hypothetical protein